MNAMRAWLLPPVKFTLLELFAFTTAAAIICWLIPIYSKSIRTILNSPPAVQRGHK